MRWTHLLVKRQIACQCNNWTMLFDYCVGDSNDSQPTCDAAVVEGGRKVRPAAECGTLASVVHRAVHCRCCIRQGSVTSHGRLPEAGHAQTNRARRITCLQQLSNELPLGRVEKGVAHQLNRKYVDCWSDGVREVASLNPGRDTSRISF